MANNDLDDFFKKKDRKGTKNKKQPGLLTNNEELHKQLVNVTSAFKENMDFDEEEDEETMINNYNRQQHIGDTNGINEDSYVVVNKNPSNSTSINNKNKTTTKISVQDSNHLNEQQTGVEQQDEWEEFVGSNSKYEQIRLKFSRGGNDHNNSGEDNDDDEYYDDGNNHNINIDDNINTNGDEQSSRNNRRREQQKDKPAWKIDQVKQTESIPTNDSVDSQTKKIEESLSSKPVTTSTAYRPPQLRGNSSVTVVSGGNQRITKKEKPNLASTEEFPTLGAAVNRK